MEAKPAICFRAERMRARRLPRLEPRPRRTRAPRRGSELLFFLLLLAPFLVSELVLVTFLFFSLFGGATAPLLNSELSSGIGSIRMERRGGRGAGGGDSSERASF
jgi:hypothetical protein